MAILLLIEGHDGNYGMESPRHWARKDQEYESITIDIKRGWELGH
ncbi:hypothetical protein SBV1_670005 [Verrucomicrobia bacterium]|nr:hypothetical protein SBV1_670005 [Verrucomicrobiota bacterium]